MTAYTDELLERKWRELGNVPIDYTPDELDGVLGTDWFIFEQGEPLVEGEPIRPKYNYNIFHKRNDRRSASPKGDTSDAKTGLYRDNRGLHSRELGRRRCRRPSGK